jgi:hypothetical protein
MPIYLQHTDMFSLLLDCEVLLATTNACVKQNGENVMGKGSAAAMARRFPHLPLMIGQKLTEDNLILGRYGICLGFPTTITWTRDAQGNPVKCNHDIRLGGFQTKYHYKDDSDPKLIKYGVDLLLKYASDKRVVLAKPGVGEGGLSHELVERLLAPLGNNVRVVSL